MVMEVVSVFVGECRKQQVVGVDNTPNHPSYADKTPRDETEWKRRIKQHYPIPSDPFNSSACPCPFQVRGRDVIARIAVSEIRPKSPERFIQGLVDVPVLLVRPEEVAPVLQCGHSTYRSAWNSGFSQYRY